MSTRAHTTVDGTPSFFKSSKLKAYRLSLPDFSWKTVQLCILPRQSSEQPCTTADQAPQYTECSSHFDIPVLLMSLQVMLSDKEGCNENTCIQVRCIHSTQNLGEKVQLYLYQLKVHILLRYSERHATLLEGNRSSHGSKNPYQGEGAQFRGKPQGREGFQMLMFSNQLSVCRAKPDSARLSAALAVCNSLPDTSLCTTSTSQLVL